MLPVLVKIASPGVTASEPKEDRVPQLLTNGALPVTVLMLFDLSRVRR